MLDAKATARLIKYAVDKSKMNSPRGYSEHMQKGSSGSDITLPRETMNASVACTYLT